MLRNIRLPFLLAGAFVLAGPLVAAEKVADLIRRGDVHYDRLQPAEALKYYLPAEKLDPENAMLLVRIARQYRHLLSEASGKEEKMRLGVTAIDYANRSVALAPDNPETHLAVAISYAKLLPYQPTKVQLTHSKIIKSSADRVLALDPRNDLAWQILGRWYLNLAEVGSVKRAIAQVVYGALPAASYEDARRCFEKAISLNPNRLMHHIELGRTYYRMDRPEEARKCLTRGLAMPNTEKDDPETKKMGRDILKKLP